MGAMRSGLALARAHASVLSSLVLVSGSSGSRDRRQARTRRERQTTPPLLRHPKRVMASRRSGPSAKSFVLDIPTIAVQHCTAGLATFCSERMPILLSVRGRSSRSPASYNPLPREHPKRCCRHIIWVEWDWEFTALGGPHSGARNRRYVSRPLAQSGTRSRVQRDRCAAPEW